MTADLRARVKGTLSDALDEGWDEDEWTDAVLAAVGDVLRERAAECSAAWRDMLPDVGPTAQRERGAELALRKLADEYDPRWTQAELDGIKARAKRRAAEIAELVDHGDQIATEAGA